MLVKMAYKTLLRPLVVKAVNDPDADWDDVLMGVIDRIFDYDGKD